MILCSRGGRQTIVLPLRVEGVGGLSSILGRGAVYSVPSSNFSSQVAYSPSSWSTSPLSPVPYSPTTSSECSISPVAYSPANSSSSSSSLFLVAYLLTSSSSLSSMGSQRMQFLK